ncbi:MAG: 2-isopropylmalate synthase [Candidatus Hadarchaeales archaeon]
MSGRVLILDTTLRDGEQTPGVALTPEEKIKIARALDDLGVDIIEAGSVATSEGERKAIKEISKLGLSAEICTFTRAMKEDIDAAIAADVDSIHLVVPASDIHLKLRLEKSRQEIKKMAAQAMDYAIKHGLKVEFSLEDATRADENFVRELVALGLEHRVHRICLCDTVGILTPARAREFYSKFAKIVNVPLAAHCHNDFGMATANTISAVEGGATEVHVTINGLGERGGNAALEEVVSALVYLQKYKLRIKMKKLYSVSKLVESLTGIPLSPTKPLVGENAFAHEAGIHVHGVLRSPKTYEPLAPEDIGQRRRIVFGKHIGRHAIEMELRKLGFRPNKEQVTEIFKQVKWLGDQGKVVTDSELRAIIDSVMGKEFEETIKLEELTVVSGNKITPTSSVKVRFRDKEMIESGVGVGPVDAAMNAIRKLIEGISNIRLLEYHVDSISGGTDAVVDVTVKLTDGKRIITARGISGDIIMASVQAMLNGVNRFLWDKYRGEKNAKRRGRRATVHT